jgi:hypothetical protein
MESIRRELGIPVIINTPNKTLHRLNDDYSIKCYSIKFLEFNENNQGKEFHKHPKVGCSCICDYFNGKYSWITSEIVEVISDNEFKTKNSHYEILEI